MGSPSPSSGRAVLCQECWKQALYTYATATIFERRCVRYQRRIRLLTFVGIGVPVVVGGVVLTFGRTASALPLILLLGGILLLLQLVGSVWALVADWGNLLAYSVESIASNYSLSNRYEALAKDDLSPEAEFRAHLQLLDVENEARETQDYKRGISDSEKRIGHRAGLRRFQRQCSSCKRVPQSMKPSKCPVCGRG